MTALPLVLGSSSPFRKELLNKLGIPFHCYSPDINEEAKPEESPEALVQRLAYEKALKVAEEYPEALIIGSDQVAVIDDEILTKPGNHANAVKQLQKASGKTATFLTGLCLLNSKTKKHQICLSPFEVSFLSLTDSQIEQYLLKEEPYNCAGSFKSEGLGITLFESLNGKDPNSLIGLPLIELTRMLRNEGLDPLAS